MYRCYPLNSLICVRLHQFKKLSIGRDINYSDIRSLHGHAACALNQHLRSNLAELQLNICEFIESNLLYVLIRRPQKLTFGPYITSLASKSKAHNSIV